MSWIIIYFSLIKIELKKSKNSQTKIAYRQINNSSYIFFNSSDLLLITLRFDDSFTFASSVVFVFFIFRLFKIMSIVQLKESKKKNCIQIEIKRIVRNEPLALCSDKRCNYVAAFTCWWFSMLFNVRLAFLTYRWCVSFAAFIRFELLFLVLACVCVDSRRWERKQKWKYVWVRIHYKCTELSRWC